MRRRRNPSTAIQTVGAVASGTAGTLDALAPLFPYLALGLGAWWVWGKLKDAFGGPAAEAAKAAAHAASAVPDAYGQAARTALDPSQWRPTYEAAEKQWQAEGGQGNPIAQPYYGPAGEWSSAPVPPDQTGG